MLPRSASIPSFLLASLGVALTAYLFNVAEAPQDRNTLLGFLVGEGVFVTWMIWSISQPDEQTEDEPIPLPRSRSQEIIPGGPTKAPQAGPPYQHRPLQPSRPPTRSSDPVPPPPAPPRRQVDLPPLPELRQPQPGRSNSRIPPPASDMPPKQTKASMKLGDLLPAAPPPPQAAPPPPPRPQPKPTPQSRPKRPRKYAAFDGESGNLPPKIDLTDLQLCCDIMTLGYTCASSDGPVTTEENDHLQGWAWCVIEKTSDKEAATFLQALDEAANLAKGKGKQRLETVAALAASIRGSGAKKFIHAAAELCGEIVAHDGRLEPGEYATLATALDKLGVRNVKAEKIADELLSADDDLLEILSDLEIDDDTSSEQRDTKLSIAWNKENARMQAINDPARREAMRAKMELIQRIRTLYREMEQFG